MRSQLCIPLDHAVLVVSGDLKGDQRIIAAYADKKKTWEEAKKNTPTSPKRRGKRATSSKISPLLTPPTKPPPLATTRPNYWDAIGLDSDDNT